MTDRPRIDLCLATTHFPPDYSGAAIRFQRYQPGLESRGVDMRVFTQAFPPRENLNGQSNTQPKNGALLPADKVNGIPIHRVYSSANSVFRQRITYYRALTRYVDEKAERPALIQFLSSPIYSIPWLRILRRRGIPLVLTQTMVGDLSSKKWKRTLQRRIWRTPFQLMDCVVVSSGVMRNFLQDIGVSTRIEVIPNGVDLNRFRPADSSDERKEMRTRLGYTPQSELILYAGPITERKGVDLLVEAWCTIAKTRPNARLLLVGARQGQTGYLRAGEAEFQSGIEEVIRQSDSGDRVLFTGHVDDIETYLKAADVLVFPSKREGMGNVVLEAFGSGLPSILTPYIGLPEEFGEPGTHYVLSERNAESLAAAMESLLEDPERRHQIALQARKLAEEHLGIETALDRYSALYKEIAGSKT